MNLIGNWNYPTSVRFGAGRIRELGAAVKAAGMARPLLVTDARLARHADRQAARCEVLADDGVAASRVLRRASPIRSPPTSKPGSRR